MRGTLRNDRIESDHERPAEAGEIRALARETEQAARRLLSRAAHLEKRASRPRTDPSECANLKSQAVELRTAADLLLVEVCELSRQARAA